jgi:hypothetical protein
MPPEQRAALRILAKSGLVGRLSPETKRALADESLPHLAFLKKKGLDGLLSMLCDVPLPLVQLYEKVWNAQRANLVSLIKELAKRDLNILITKSAEHIETLFHSRPLRFRGDVDILVPRDKLQKTKRALLELGYTQSLFDTNRGQLVAADEGEISAYEKDHYNLRSFAKLERINLLDYPYAVEESWTSPLLIRNGEGICVIAVDVSCGLDRRTDPAPLFDRAVPSTFPGAMTFSPEDHLWTSAALYYFQLFSEPSPRLDRMAAIVAMVNSRKMDWNIILETAERLQVRPSLFYIFHFVEKLLPGPIPLDLLAALDPRKGTRLRDFGWLLPKAFDALDPFPFSFESGDML